MSQIRDQVRLGGKKVLRDLRRRLYEANKGQPKELVEVHRSTWPPSYVEWNRTRVFRSRFYLVQVFEEANDIIRLSVNRAEIDDNGDWKANLSWDELMEVKRQCGYGDRWAVEIHPADKEIVNVANLRHLWLLPEAPSYAWRNKP